MRQRVGQVQLDRKEASHFLQDSSALRLLFFLARCLVYSSLVDVNFGLLRAFEEAAEFADPLLSPLLKEAGEEIGLGQQMVFLRALVHHLQLVELREIDVHGGLLYVVHLSIDGLVCKGLAHLFWDLILTWIE